MYWDRYIHRDNPRRIEPLDKPLDTYVMLDTETTGLNPEEGSTLIEIGAFLVQPGNENSRPKFEQLIDPRQPLSEFITGLTGITDQMLQGMPTAGAAMLRFHQWLDRTWPAGEPLAIIAHNAEFDVSFLDAAERVYDPTASGFDCRWLCTKEMSWELNPQKRHHRVTDLIADYHIGDTEITAAAKYLKANPGLFGPSACFIDPNRFGEIARGMLQAARTALQVH